MIRNPGDCYAALRLRPNPNGEGSTANLENQVFAATKVFPNPVEDVLHVESSNRIEYLILRDIQGKVILERSPAVFQFQLEMGDILSGVYFLEVHTLYGKELIKVMK
jgi:hypothetical protein